MRILGRDGAFLLNQFEDDGADIYPDLAHSDAGKCGWIYLGDQRTPVTRPAAGQVDFYRQVVRALATPNPQAAMPVDPYDAVHTLAVIDAARASDAHGTVEQVRTLIAKSARSAALLIQRGDDKIFVPVHLG